MRMEFAATRGPCGVELQRMRKPRGTLAQAVRKHLDYWKSKPELSAADKRSLDLAIAELVSLARTAARKKGNQ